MKGKVSEIAARLIVKAWYQDSVEDFKAEDQWMVESHFEAPRVGDVFMTDLGDLVLRREEDGWYLMPDPGEVL